LRNTLKYLRTFIDQCVSCVYGVVKFEKAMVQVRNMREFCAIRNIRKRYIQVTYPF
jgi:hypothetical protein